MRILKKNQVIVLVIALTLVSVGYLSYTNGNSMNENTKESSIIGEVTQETEYAGIGDAKLVNSKAVENEEQLAKIENNENENNEDTNETKQTIANKTINKDLEEYFSSSRLNRDKMYSQMIESYQKILESESISEEQKSIAQTEIKNINEMKNKIMICENLIKNKGIEDLVIFVNDKSINIIVKSDTLDQTKIAQIQNIIQREMNSEIEDIHISNK